MLSKIPFIDMLISFFSATQIQPGVHLEWDQIFCPQECDPLNLRTAPDHEVIVAIVQQDRRKAGCLVIDISQAAPPITV